MLDELFGKSFHWDDESVREEAKKYNTRYEFSIKSSGAYMYALKHNMIDTLFNTVMHYWDDKSVKEESKKYKTRTEFEKGSVAA